MSRWSASLGYGLRPWFCWALLTRVGLSQMGQWPWHALLTGLCGQAQAMLQGGSQTDGRGSMSRPAPFPAAEPAIPLVLPNASHGPFVTLAPPAAAPSGDFSSLSLSTPTLLKPSFFQAPPVSEASTPVPTLAPTGVSGSPNAPREPLAAMQPHGAPLLQPFPPPAPPASLASPSPSTTSVPVTLTREVVRSALFRLLQVTFCAWKCSVCWLPETIKDIPAVLPSLGLKCDGG